jgi:hypothetical protein
VRAYSGKFEKWPASKSATKENLMTKTYENVTITKGETAGILWLETETRMLGVKKVARYETRKTSVRTLYREVAGREIYDVVTDLETGRSWIASTYQEVQ